MHGTSRSSRTLPTHRMVSSQIFCSPCLLQCFLTTLLVLAVILGYDISNLVDMSVIRKGPNS